MQITGKGIWGPPRDHDEAIRVLRRSPVMLPIPDTSLVKHLEENLGAVAVRLRDTEVLDLERAV